MQTTPQLSALALLCCALAVTACDRGRNTDSAKSNVRELAYTDDQFPTLSLNRIVTLCTDPQDCQFREITAGARGQNGETYLGGPVAEVTSFDAEGQPIGTIGWVGSGPGEYRLIGPLEVDAQGKLTVFDAVGLRAISFAQDGNHVNTVRLQLPHGVPSTVRMRHGRVFMLMTPPSASLEDTVEARFAEITATAVTPTEPSIRTRARMLTGAGGSPQREFFDADLLGDVDEHFGVVFSSASRYRVERIDARGAMQYVITVDVQPLPVTPEDVESEIQLRLGQPPVPPPIRQSVQERAKRAPSHHPVLGDVRIFDGLLFVKRNARGTPSRWDVFNSATGTPWGTFELPPNARLLDADSTQVLTADVNEDGMPIATWYGMRR